MRAPPIRRRLNLRLRLSRRLIQLAFSCAGWALLIVSQIHIQHAKVESLSMDDPAGLPGQAVMPSPGAQPGQAARANSAAAAVGPQGPSKVVGPPASVKVNETRFPIQDWWLIDPRQQHPRCADLRCVFGPDCPTTDPTCCTFWLYGMLEFVSWFFTEHKLRWAITYGTLLGAVRGNHIIGWTPDIDIGLVGEDWTQLSAGIYPQLRQEAWRHGFMVHAGAPETATRMCYHLGHPAVQALQPDVGEAQSHDLPRLYADVYHMQPLENTPQHYKFTVKEDSLSDALLTFEKFYDIHGLHVPGLDDAPAVLTHWYGPNYMRAVIG